MVEVQSKNWALTQWNIDFEYTMCPSYPRVLKHYSQTFINMFCRYTFYIQAMSGHCHYNMSVSLPEIIAKSVQTTSKAGVNNFIFTAMRRF